MCYDLPHILRTLAFLASANTFLTDFSPSLTLLFIAFQYPQLNLSQLLKSSWVRTGMFNLHNTWRPKRHGVREGIWGLTCLSCFPNPGQDKMYFKFLAENE